KLRRWAGGPQGTEDDRPSRGQPGVVSPPKGTARTQGEKVRELFCQCGGQRTGVTPTASAHAYVATARGDPAGRSLHLFPEIPVALTAAQLLVPPMVHRVCTGTDQGRPPRPEDLAHAVEGADQIGRGLLHRLADSRDHFDLRLHQFVAQGGWWVPRTELGKFGEEFFCFLT